MGNLRRLVAVVSRAGKASMTAPRNSVETAHNGTYVRVIRAGAYAADLEFVELGGVASPTLWCPLLNADRARGLDHECGAWSGFDVFSHLCAFRCSVT